MHSLSVSALGGLFPIAKALKNWPVLATKIPWFAVQISLNVMCLFKSLSPLVLQEMLETAL